MNMKKCNKPVKYQYAWGGSLKVCCEDHMKQIQVVAGITGNNCDFQEIKSKEKCPNVVGE